MLRFRGITRLTVDSKGRVALPKLQREKLEKEGVRELVITLDPHRCLVIYPTPIWEELEPKIMALSKSNEYAVMLQRTLVAHATDFELDAAGRVLLSSDLRAESSIDRKVVLVGQGKKLELWDERAWEAESATWDGTLSGATAENMPAGLEDIEF